MARTKACRKILCDVERDEGDHIETATQTLLSDAAHCDAMSRRTGWSAR